MIFIDREQALGNRLIADGIRQHGHEEGRPLIEDGISREEVGLLRRDMLEPFHQLRRAPHGKEHGRNDDDGDGHQCHQLGEIRQYRGAEARPERIAEHPDPRQDDACLEGQRRQHRDKRTGGREVDHQADDAAQHVGEGQNQLAARTVACMDQLAQRMGVGGQLAEAAAEGIDEQDHQRAPESIVDRA